MGTSDPRLYGEIGLSQPKVKAVDGTLSAEARPGLPPPSARRLRG
jgi:hypothetical protein